MAPFLASARAALTQGDLAACCETLHASQAQIPRRYHNEVILHQASVQKLREEERRGIISDESLSRERRRLTSVILDLLDLIEKAIPPSFPNNVVPTVSISSALTAPDITQQNLAPMQSGLQLLYAELELTIHPSGDRYAAEARFRSPTHDVLPATDVPVTIDLVALRTLSLDPEGYGRQLTAALFADPRLRAAWQQIRAVAQQLEALRLRLRFDISAPELHDLHWELLRDPENDELLALSERVRLSRYLESRDFSPLNIPLRPELRALIVVANPSDLGHFNLAELDVDGEVARAKTALGDLPTTIIGGNPQAQQQHATLAAIASALRDGPQLVLLICHGTIVDGEPYLWLEREDGTSDRVSGAIFVETLAQLPSQPLLLILASCQSGGRGYDDTLAALGTRLARAGVAAVLAFQGNVSVTTVRRLLPPLFAELRRDGSIDRALAAARAVIRQQAEWWLPVLWLRVRDGQLWFMEQPATPAPTPDRFEPLVSSSGKRLESGQQPEGLAQAVQVRELLATYFNDGELRTLCFDLGIDYENLPGQGKADKARELVAYVQRHQQENRLIAECRRLRNMVTWPELTSTLSPKPQSSTRETSPAYALPLEPPEGTMRPDSPFYIDRQPADRVALATAQAQLGGTLTIKGPRQVGKSSLLIRVMARAGEVGKHVAYLDFQQFDEGARADADTFFLQFARWLNDELGLAELRDIDWPLALGTVQRCTRYIERVLLPALGGPVLLAMDEVDSILDCPFRTDFFAMLRVWHNNRAMPNRPIWRKLDLALVTSTEPYELVQNLHQSPFNVGEVIELIDFDAQQVARLNALHGNPLTQGNEARLIGLLAGHPYLTRRALYLVADGRLSAEDLFTHAASESGPFGEHLRRHQQRLNERPELAQAFRQILHTQRASDDRAFWRLRGAGLVRREGERSLARCQLYADYFTERLR